MLENCCILIPARKGSKGFVNKNRVLFNIATSKIPESCRDLVYVSTNDEFIKKEARKQSIKVIDRPDALSQDTSSLKDVMTHFVDSQNLDEDVNIILLFLTYPEREWDDVLKIYEFFQSREEKSLACCEELDKHPYLCFFQGENLKGHPIIDHKFYRRQDYPECFVMSLYVGCYEVSIIPHLHDLMYEKDSIFYKLDKKRIDVDRATDFENFKQRQPRAIKNV